MFACLLHFNYDKNYYYILYIFYATLLQEVHLQKCMEIYGLAARFSERFKLQSNFGPSNSDGSNTMDRLN